MADYYVTPAGAGSKDGSSWSNAFGEPEFEASLEASAAAGDIYWIMEGTYTLDSAYDSSARDGTAAAPISLVGVKSGTTATPPTIADLSDANLGGGTDDRPLIDAGANAVLFGDYYKFICLRFTTTAANGIQCGTYGRFYNCKSVGSSATANRYCFYTGTDALFVHCEASGLIGTGVDCYAFGLSSRGMLVYCYAHDCKRVINTLATSGYYAVFSIFEDVSEYAISGAGSTLFAINVTFHDCAVAVNQSTATIVAINNLLDGCTTSGFNQGTQADHSFYLNNHGNDTRNTDMWVNIATTLPHGDFNNTTGDPLFDGDGNLSLQAGSPCIGAGTSAILGT